MKKVVCIYSDASFSQKHKLAVAGALLFPSLKQHASGKVELGVFHTTEFSVENNIRAELMGVIWALELVIEKARPKVGSEIRLYTDCQTVVELPQRRAKLEAKSFKSGRTGNLLKNADLYRKFFSLIDEVSIQLFWLKGHAPKREQSLFRKHFSYVDQCVRKKLREVTQV